MARLYKLDQGCYWEMEIDDGRIIAVTPNDGSSVVVSYMDEHAVVKTAVCDKISFV